MGDAGPGVAVVIDVADQCRIGFGKLLAGGEEDGLPLTDGVGNWHLYNGRRDEAVSAFRQVLTSDQWPAFGYIAAEADLKRLGEKP